MLKCYVVGRNLINGTPEEYKVAEGAVFIENFNETLDSGTIILPQLDHTIEIEPYDVIVIYSTADSVCKITEKRFCVDTVKCIQTCLNPLIYKYEISLFSETKLLEGILLPSLSITKRKGNYTPRNIFQYMDRYRNQYGPKLHSSETGPYDEKFTFGSNMFDSSEFCSTRFGAIECPEMQWNEPTFREVLTDLMMANDCIPVLKNNRICYYDISQTKGEITDEQKQGINYIIQTMSSTDYVSEIKSKMVNGVTRDTNHYPGERTHICEEIGFRNFETYLLDTENVKVETTFPIWRLNEIYLKFKVTGGCYYTDGNGDQQYDGNIEGTANVPVYQDYGAGDNMGMVLEYSTWQTKDIYYDGFTTSNKSISTDYQNTCLYWKRGERGIHNFNAKYERQFLWINSQVSVLELLLNTGYGGTAQNTALREGCYSKHPDARNVYVDVIDPVDYQTCRFTVDYEPLCEHTIFASKGNMPRNKRQIVDNQTQPFININKYGMLEYLKANRLGNKVKLINARYETDEVNIPELSATIDGSVIFRKEIAVFDNFLKVNYQATDNYVLRDYFTGIKSKLRGWKIVDGNEAFVRADTIKFYVNSRIPSIANSTYVVPSYSTLQKYLDDFKYCLIRFNTNEGVKPNPNTTLFNGVNYNVTDFYVEFTKALCGNSVLLTIKMIDNAIVGKYVASENKSITIGSETVKAMAQKNASYVDSHGEHTGGVIRFYKDYDEDMSGQTETTKNALRKLFPNAQPGRFSNLVANIPFQFIKDNKEITQITIQFELNEEANDMFLGKK